jgi:hypothetical protein
MSYIIIWRSTNREPFVNVDSYNFLEDYPTYEKAKEVAEEILLQENQTTQSPWYFNYKIYEEK